MTIRYNTYTEEESAPPPVAYRLVRDAARVVDEMAGQWSNDASRGCYDDGGPTVELVVYQGAQSVPVTVEPFGCELIAGWGEDRTGAKAVFALLLELLERQRIATPDPDATRAARPDPLYAQLTVRREPLPHWDAITRLDYELVGPPYPAVGARVCWYERTNAGPMSALLDAAAAEDLRAEVVG